MNAKQSNKQNNSRKKKRKWNGVVAKNQQKKVLNVTSTASDTDISCASSRKLDASHVEAEISSDYFVIINLSIIKDITSQTLCQKCCSPISITDIVDSRMGLCHLLELKCTKCTYIETFHSSYKSKPSQIPSETITHLKKNIVAAPYEINLRSVIAFREVGAGHAAMKVFTSGMNLFCLSQNGYKKINKTTTLAYRVVAEKSMQKAAAEAKAINDCPGIKRSRVSIDGSWQKRGHSSLNDVVTAISGDKCVDVEVFTKHCNGCKMWNNKKGTPEYQCWLVDHECEINHERSSGSMESAGAIAIFNRSITKNNIIYEEYLGDGDTSSYNDVKNAHPYKERGVIPIKLECVGHVQKRLGTRLRNLVKAHKGTKTPLQAEGN